MRLGLPILGLGGGGQISLAAIAAGQLGGIAPYHYADFISNRMLYAGVDVGTVSGGTGYSFTRASTGYYTNADGTLTSFASGALRRGNRGVLIEGARTNLLVRSQEFDNASWTKTNATITANAIAAPDGTSTADKLVENTSNSTHQVSQSATTTAVPHTFSVYAKAAERSFVLVYHQQTAAGTVFNLSTGAADGNSDVATPTSAGIESLGDGWYRCWIVVTATAASNGFRVYPMTGAGAAAYLYEGDGASGLYLWGAQLEAASFPSSYIPTTTASATRAAEPYRAATTSGLDSAVSMWSEIIFPVSAGAIQTIAQFDDGTDNNRLILRRNASGNAEMELITGGASQGIVTGGAMSNNATHKIACSATANALRLSLNGTSATPDTSASMPTGLANIRIGAGNSTALPSFAYQPRFAMFNSALSAANLDTVTT